jgi:hypothetical protein
MSVHAFRRPETRLTRACRTVKEAVDEFERLVARGEDEAANAQWKRVQELARAFCEGHAFALSGGRL